MRRNRFRPLLAVMLGIAVLWWVHESVGAEGCCLDQSCTCCVGVAPPPPITDKRLLEVRVLYDTVPQEYLDELAAADPGFDFELWARSIANNPQKIESTVSCYFTQILASSDPNNPPAVWWLTGPFTAPGNTTWTAAVNWGHPPTYVVAAEHAYNVSWTGKLLPCPANQTVAVLTIYLMVEQEPL